MAPTAEEIRPIATKKMRRADGNHRKCCSYLDGPDEHGRIPDDRRIQFLRGYLDELGRAMLHSCNVRPYHHGSLMDNFEWAEGDCQRFGLVYVDFRSLKRTMKESGKWYAKLADTGDLQ